MNQKTILYAYYGGTIIFLLLDLVAGFNMRVAFLEDRPGWRMAYYVFCMACFLLMVWRPHRAALIGALESLLTLVALILSMGIKVMLPSVELPASGAGVVSAAELLNFLLAGGVAYIAWGNNMQELFGRRSC